jgi:hypothetical protein
VIVRTTLVASVALMLVAIAIAIAIAAAAPPDLKRLVLQLSDFPGGTRTEAGAAINGSLASTYTATYQVRPGDLKREEDVEIQVWVAKDAASAKNIYDQTLATYTGKGPKIAPFAAAFKGESVLQLPTYGDEQFADYLPNPQRPHGQLIVLKGDKVWYLTVENCSPLATSCYGTSRVEQPIGKTQATAELKKYGAKQNAHLGAH